MKRHEKKSLRNLRKSKNSRKQAHECHASRGEKKIRK
jgi:hypothetical protein